MSHIKKPSPALVVASLALFLALTGGAYAASRLLITNSQIANGAVSRSKIANGAVGASNLNSYVNGEIAAHSAPGPGGVALTGVPAIGGSSTNPAGNGDSGSPNSQGFYFTGEGPGGAATLINGELSLEGTGVDGNTFQGGIGLAHAYNKVPLKDLDALAYVWHVNQANVEQAPTIHITVTGATEDSKFSSGFTNLTYSPDLSGGVDVSPSVVYQSDTLAPGAGWYSSDDSNTAGSINQTEPLSYFAIHDPNAVIVQISVDNGGSSTPSTGEFQAAVQSLLLGFTGSPFVRYELGG